MRSNTWSPRSMEKTIVYTRALRSSTKRIAGSGYEIVCPDVICAIYVPCFSDDAQFMCEVLAMYFNARFSIALAGLDRAGLKIENLDDIETFYTYKNRCHF